MKALATFVLGVIVGVTIAAHVITNEVQARNAQVKDSLDASEAQTLQTNDLALKTVAAWRGRAESCEAKFDTMTVIYQQQAIATIPLMKGVAAVQVVPGGGALKPSLVIPAQVDVYSYRTDLQYQWIDAKSGEPKSILQPAKTAVQ